MSSFILVSTAEAPREERTAAFWRRHLLWPAAAFAATAALFEATTLDTRIAAWFYDQSAGRWRWGDAWWSNGLIHTGGRLLIWLIGLTALGLWIASWLTRAARPVRREVGYVFLSILLGAGTVGLLKRITNIDCPRDLELFGGDRPYVRLFEDRPSDLPRGRCFPSSHSAEGFSLLCFYFLFRYRSRIRPRLGLAVGLGAGLIFGFGQSVRGAHFVSHVVWAAFICWLWSLGLYVWLLRPADPPL